MADQGTAPLRIGNASGFYGDRAAAVREMLTGGDLDFLTGDYLAELTMLILARDRASDPSRGYARSFLRQMETGLGLAADRGVRIVVNAGGLNPAGLAAALRDLTARLGLSTRIAHVEGDDLLARAAELGLDQPPTTPGAASPTSGVGSPAAGGPSTASPDASGNAARPPLLAANAYLGAFGIVAALQAGAEVVVTGRVTDASLVVGPAAAHFGWTAADHDALAGAMVAGHVIECGTQATGGNFAAFTEIADLTHPGFPIAEIFADGSSVITKHPGTGGAVTRDTVTAQLLYEIGGPRYLGPDATARFDTITLHDDGPDRVRITGVQGEAPPSTLKVGCNTLGGFRNEVTFVLTGLDLDAKAALLKKQLTPALPSTHQWTLARTDHPDAATEEEASALLRVVVRSSDPDDVGRRFSGAAIELALASYPGFHVTAPPSKGAPYGVFHSVAVPADTIPHVTVLHDGTRIDIDAPTDTADPAPVDEPTLPASPAATATRRGPLGEVMLARSGDKGGSANIGVWVRSDEAFAWLVHELTVDRLGELLPEVAPLPVERHVLVNLRAINFVVHGILGEGVASNVRFDPQAKALGEWLRARHVDLPEALA